MGVDRIYATALQAQVRARLGGARCRIDAYLRIMPWPGGTHIMRSGGHVEPASSHLLPFSHFFFHFLSLSLFGPSCANFFFLFLGPSCVQPLFFGLIGKVTLQLLRVRDIPLQVLILEICYSHMSFNTLGPPAEYVSLLLFYMDHIALL